MKCHECNRRDASLSGPPEPDIFRLGYYLCKTCIMRVVFDGHPAKSKMGELGKKLWESGELQKGRQRLRDGSDPGPPKRRGL